jgi:hypothetical protein
MTEWLKIGSAIVRLDDVAAVHYSVVSRPTVEVFTSGGRPYTALDHEAEALWAWWSALAIDVLEERPLHRRAKLVD